MVNNASCCLWTSGEGGGGVRLTTGFTIRVRAALQCFTSFRVCDVSIELVLVRISFDTARF